MNSGDERMLWAHPLMFVCGAAPVALALMVLTGWYTESISLVQVLPALAPMQVNTALGFLLCGTGLVSYMRRHTFLVTSFGLAAALIGLLTFSQYLFRIELGIDQLLLEPFVTVKTTHPGRMALNTSLSFLFSGLGLVFLGRSSPKRYAGLIAGILGSFVFGQAAVVGVTYVAGVEYTFGWGQLTHMAVHTALGFAFVGTGLLVAAWSKGATEEERVPIWLPFPIGIAVATLTFGLWLSLSAENSAQIDRSIALKAENLKIGLDELIKAKINALTRLAKRWEQRGGTPRIEWESDTALYVANDPSYQAIEWIDRAFRVRWIMPVKGNEHLEQTDLGLTSYRRDLLTTARHRGSVPTSQVINLTRGGKGLQILIPLFPAGQFDGFILGVFRIDKLLAAYLEKELARYSVHIFEGDEKIYDDRNNTDLHSEKRRQEFHLDIHGTIWRVAIHPTPEMLVFEKSVLPFIILIVGLLMSAVLALMVNLAIKAGRTAKETARADQNEKFNAALSSMSQGLCMFDGEQRLIVCNELYASMYGLSSELVKPGTRLQEIVEYRIANGLFVGASPDEYRNERSNWGRDKTTEKKIQHFSDGRTIAVSRQPLTGGGWVTTHEDVTEITQAQQLVQRQKNELKESMQRLGEARKVAGFGNWEWNIVTSDLIWSEEIYSIFGLQQNAFDASYDAFLNSVHPEDRQMVEDAVRQAVEEKKTYNLDHRIVLPDGEIRTVHEWGKVTYDTDGKPLRMIGIVQDVTDRIRVERELMENRDHLQELVGKATQELKVKTDELKEALTREQELSKLQRQFVTMASHEFRTPLAIIDATAQRMKSRADKNRLTPEDAAQRVEKIRTAVARMTRLMESTLDAAHMEEGKIKIEIGECDLRYVLFEVLTNQNELSPNHNITCDLQEFPDMIQGDSGALTQIFSNLISNAVKYSADAPDIKVVGCTEGDQVVISVCDYGIGIDEDELGRIGERFFRAKTSTGTPGTGIGLNLVKMLVKMHGGTFNVESKKGEGSTFTICLPIAGPNQSEQADSLVA